MDITELEDNKRNLQILFKKKSYLVPFLGAGFCAPTLPTWSDFLDKYFQDVRSKYFSSEDEKKYLSLKNGKQANNYELMANLLIDATERGKFEEQINMLFDKTILPDHMKKKFFLLHNAFRGLKITSNFDRLIESNSFGSYVTMCRSNNPGEMDRLLIKCDEENSIIKIHGDIKDIPSIILTRTQYESFYGHPTRFDPQAPLPTFLKKLFTSKSLLFIGCSLVYDRLLMILEEQKHVRKHFAIVRLPRKKKELQDLLKRLSRFNITPIWIHEFVQVEQVLEMLAGDIAKEPVPRELYHNTIFVGREEELKEIELKIKKIGKKSVKKSPGNIFVIEGAAGMGKTAIAIEVIKRFQLLFTKGITAYIQVNKYSPMSFVTHLIHLLNLPMAFPPGPKTAQSQLTNILEKHKMLLLLDNAVDVDDLHYMLPLQTESVILITTRNRDIYDYLRLHFPGLSIHKISLKKFTEKESMDLFEEMLGDHFKSADNESYLQIAKILDFLPLAMRQAISLMLFRPHYTAKGLKEKLSSEDHFELLSKAQLVDGVNYQQLETLLDLSTSKLMTKSMDILEYLSLCAPGPVPGDFLVKVVNNQDVVEHLEQLYTFSLCERVEIDNRRCYELSPFIREFIRKKSGCRFAGTFIKQIENIFLDPKIHYSLKEKWMPQLHEALDQAIIIRYEGLINWVYPLFEFCDNRGYGDFYIRLTEELEKHYSLEKDHLKIVYGNRALFLRKIGKINETISLFNQVEEICKELKDPEGLSTFYGNHANVLTGKGNLNGALRLFQQQEKISRECKNRDQLGISYMGQAHILGTWGQIDKALELLKKTEKIYLDTENRKGLAICYGNQANFFYAKGELKRAEKLYKKERIIVEEQGDLEGIVRSYFNQIRLPIEKGKLNEARSRLKELEDICKKQNYKKGVARIFIKKAILESKNGNLKKAMNILKEAENIFEELGDQANLAVCYNEQHIILAKWGLFQDAINRLRQAEIIFKEIGDMKNLALAWWNQGHLYGIHGKHRKWIEMLKKSIDMKRSIGLPTDDDEKILAKISSLRYRIISKILYFWTEFFEK